MPSEPPPIDIGVWSPGLRRLTVGLVATVTLVAFEALSVATVMPVVGRQLGDLRLYGWVFSAFFLASLVGVSVAGPFADRSGVGGPMLAGLGLFAAGLAVGGTAPAMPVLVAGRLLQGLGAGAVPAAAYTAIGRGYPPGARPRMFAVLSTAWVVPGVIGPSAASLVAAGPGWRWVFLGLVPLVAVAALVCLPAIGGIPIAVPDSVGPAPVATGSHRTASAATTPAVHLAGTVAVAGAAALLLIGLETPEPAAGVGLVALALAGGVPALRRVLPRGTLRAAAGIPAAVATRGLLTFGFFAADAYVPYTVITARHAATALGGITLTAATVAWTAGSWVQARWIGRVGPRTLVWFGLLAVFTGIAGMAVLLSPSVPVDYAVLAWAVAGLGMGIGYAPISIAALDLAPPGGEGRASAAVQLTDLLGTALGTGAAGAALAEGHRSALGLRGGLLVAFALAGAAAVIGTIGARRMPTSLGAGAPGPTRPGGAEQEDTDPGCTGYG